MAKEKKTPIVFPWHDRLTEKPQEGRQIAFMDGDRIRGMEYSDNRHCNSWLGLSDRWAYTEDLVCLTATTDAECLFDDLDREAERDVCSVVNECSATGIPNDRIASWVQDAMINEFKRGAKWLQARLLDIAVDGEVNHILGRSWVSTSDKELSESLKRFQHNDNVKVIIVKADEQ